MMNFANLRTRIKLTFVSVSLGVLCISGYSSAKSVAGDFATESYTAYSQAMMQLAPARASNLVVSTPEAVEAQMKLVSKQAKTRNPSNALVADPSLQSEDYKKYVANFLKVQSADQLETFIDSEVSKYNTYKDEDVKLAVATLATLKPMRGFIWRIVPVLEPARALHSMLLSTADRMASTMSVYFPTAQWKAGFDYVTMPYAQTNADGSQSIVSTFPDERSIQGFFVNEMGPALEVAYNRISALSFEKQYRVFDNQVFYGNMSFQDGRDRYRLMGELEKHIVLAGLARSIVAINVGRAFCNQNAVAFAKAVGNLYGFDGFITNQVQGVTGLDIYKVSKESKYKNLGVIYPDGDKFLKAAWISLKEYVNQMEIIWQDTEARPDGGAFFIKGVLARTESRKNDLRIANMKALVKGGPATISSHITGEPVTVNLEAFFNIDPKTKFDVKSLLATHYADQEQSTDWVPMNLKVGGKTVSTKYRNFFHGEPDRWQTNVFHEFFPSIKTDADVKTTARVLSQTWGSSLAAVPLMTVVK